MAACLKIHCLFEMEGTNIFKKQLRNNRRCLEREMFSIDKYNYTTTHEFRNRMDHKIAK